MEGLLQLAQYWETIAPVLSAAHVLTLLYSKSHPGNITFPDAYI